MKTSTKILIGAGVLGAGFLAYKLLTKPKPVPAPALAPGGTVNDALNTTVQNVQTVPTNVKPGALIASTGAKNLLDKVKQNVASPVVTKPAMAITKPVLPVMTTTKPVLPVMTKPVQRPGVNQFGVKFY
jgi:hypothetical protein